MTDGAPTCVVYFSSLWSAAGAESSFVARGLAGALSRHAHVRIVTPGPVGKEHADGLFNLTSIGEGAQPGSWPDPATAVIPSLPVDTFAMFDDWDGAALDIIRLQLPDARLIAVSTGGVPDEADLCLTLTRGTRGTLLERGDLDASVVHSVDFHVPVNPLAAERRHNALGTTGYLLVLTDRHGAEVNGQPNPAASWLTARFPQENVLVVEEGSASLWHLRSLHGVMSVDTRTDLWRLVAHARAVIDLAPGPYIARECLESLRFGTPIIVPGATVAAEHAANGGGLWFGDAAELMASAEVLEDQSLRDRFSRDGQAMADARFGDRAAFVANVGRALQAARENSRWCLKGS